MLLNSSAFEAPSNNFDSNNVDHKSKREIEMFFFGETLVFVSKSLMTGF